MYANIVTKTARAAWNHDRYAGDADSAGVVARYAGDIRSVGGEVFQGSNYEASADYQFGE